jgi:transcriptional regulator with XRE-family HTH domain
MALRPREDPRLIAFGNVMMVQRKLRRLTQEEVAHRAKTSPSQLTAIERAKKDVQITTMLRMVKALGMGPGEFWLAYEEELRRMQDAEADAARSVDS